MNEILCISCVVEIYSRKKKVSERVREKDVVSKKEKKRKETKCETKVKIESFFVDNDDKTTT